MSKDLKKTDDAAYQGLVVVAVNMTAELTKKNEANTITWYWNIGSLFAEFAKLAQAKETTHTAKDFASDIRAGSQCEIGESTLYCARQIHDRYEKDKIPELVQKGYTVGHLKLIMPLDDKVKKRVEDKLIGSDGKIVTIAALGKLIEDHRKVAIQQSTDDARSTADRAPSSGSTSDEPAGEEPDMTDPDVLDRMGQGPSVETAPDVPPKPDDGKTGTRGMSETAEFSINPLKALKAFDKAATAVLGKAPDLITALAEAIKVGYDSEKARENFLEQVTNVETALNSIAEILPDLQARVAETKKNV